MNKGSETDLGSNAKVTVETLKSLVRAFNSHDVDAIMEFFVDDCVLEMPRGRGPGGMVFEGKEQVRRGLASRFEGLPDVHYGEDRRRGFRSIGVDTDGHAVVWRAT